MAHAPTTPKHQWLRRFRISGKLTLLLLPILALAAALGLGLMGELWGRYQRARETQAVAVRCVTTGRVLHALQAERGLSSGFLSGASNTAVLQGQRQRVGEALSQAQAGTPNAERGPLTRLASQLETLRGQVDGRTVPAAEAVTAYSREIATLLNGLDLNQAGPEARALQRLQWAKEAAGQERATGVAAITVGSLSLTSLGRFASLAALQEDRLHQAGSLLQGSEAMSLEALSTPASFGSLLE